MHKSKEDAIGNMYVCSSAPLVFKLWCNKGDFVNLVNYSKTLTSENRAPD